MMLVWIKFLFLTIAISLLCYFISKFVVGIEQKTSLSTGFLGVILLPITTSLPEIISAFYSQSVSDAKYAVYNMIGSNSLTQAALAFSFVVFFRHKVQNKFDKLNKITLAILIFISFILIYPIVLPSIPNKIILGTSTPLLVVLVVYIIYVLKTKDHNYQEESTQKTKLTKNQALLGFFLSAIALTFCSVALLKVVDEIAVYSPLVSQSLAGLIFLSLATTMPEILVFYWMTKHKAYSMAINGILGSDLFNLSILTLADILVINGSAMAFVYSKNDLAIIGKLYFLIIAYILMYVFVSLKKSSLKNLSAPIVGLFSMALYLFTFNVSYIASIIWYNIF